MTTRTSLYTLAACVFALSACDSNQKPTELQRPTPEPVQEPPPLQTVVMSDESIVPIQEEGGRAPRRVGVPCAWAKIWAQPGGPRPMAVGGMVKTPKKIKEVEPVLPYRRTDTKGTPVLEVIIDTAGDVAEVQVLQSFDPPWPEGDAAIVAAVRQWKYEPTVLDGEAIPVCANITLSIQWTDVRRD